MLKKRLVLGLIVQGFWCMVFAQQHTVSGTLSEQGGVEISLKGYDGFKTKVFSTATIAEDGSFSLAYPHEYKGMGLLEVKQQGSFLVILAHEEVKLQGNRIQNYQEFSIHSPENQYMDTYIREQAVRNGKRDGWKWLEAIYAKEDTTTATYAHIVNELQQLAAEESVFIDGIPQHHYASYYLPLRKLIEDRSATVNRYVERVAQHIKDFYAYDLAHKDLWQSGVMQQFYEGHFVMLENVYSVQENAYNYMQQSIDHVITQLSEDDEKLLEVAAYLFKLFERRSLFPAAEYLSLQMLSQNSCTVEGELARRFEQYQTMKEGNKAPNIFFHADDDQVVRGIKNNEKTLYEIDSRYTLVVFWASSCGHCMEEMPKLQAIYAKLQTKNIEVVSVSLDTDRAAFLSASTSYPWYSYCDFKEWNSQAVLDYYVFATPSFYLLDKDNMIVKKIKSVSQLEAIIETFLE